MPWLPLCRLQGSAHREKGRRGLKGGEKEAGPPRDEGIGGRVWRPGPWRPHACCPTSQAGCAGCRLPANADGLHTKHKSHEKPALLG